MDLKRKIRRPKPVRWRKIAAAASISIGLSSAALFGLSFTSFAQEIPIIGQVFKWFNDDGFYENYSEHANALSMTQEDNGISITLNEAVFDGKMLYVTYELLSETDLGDTPSFKGMPAILNHDGGHMATGTDDIKKVDDIPLCRHFKSPECIRKIEWRKVVLISTSGDFTGFVETICG